MFDLTELNSEPTIVGDAPRWCPVCAIVLKPFARNGVEMDICPQCLGVWLDQGELDNLIRRSVTIEVVEPATPPVAAPSFALR